MFVASFSWLKPVSSRKRKARTISKDLKVKREALHRITERLDTAMSHQKTNGQGLLLAMKPPKTGATRIPLKMQTSKTVKAFPRWCRKYRSMIYPEASCAGTDPNRPAKSRERTNEMYSSVCVIKGPQILQPSESNEHQKIKEERPKTDASGTRRSGPAIKPATPAEME